jgi:hypothetical protein
LVSLARRAGGPEIGSATQRRDRPDKDDRAHG